MSFLHYSNSVRKHAVQFLALYIISIYEILPDGYAVKIHNRTFHRQILVT